MFNRTCVLSALNLSEQAVELDVVYMLGLSLNNSCLMAYGPHLVFHLD